jgi:GT2 family glycosyltransferase
MPPPVSPSGPDVSILMVNWNGAALVRRAIEAIIAAVKRPYELIVVDNGSVDDSRAVLEGLAAGRGAVRLIFNPGNYGFAHANNQAYALARGRFILLLNSDVVLAEQALEALLDYAATRPLVGLVTCAQVDSRGRPQHLNRRWPDPLTAALVFGKRWRPVEKYLLLGRVRRRYRMEGDQPSSPRRIDQAGAAVALLKREAIEAIGGLFDEAFPLFFNDVDLSWRLQQAGYEVHEIPTTVVHDGGSSVRKLTHAERDYHLKTGLFTFYRKHWSPARNRWLRILLGPPPPPPVDPQLTPPAGSAPGAPSAG